MGCQTNQSFDLSTHIKGYSEEYKHATQEGKKRHYVENFRNLFDFLPADATVRQIANMLEKTLKQAHDLMVTEEQQENDIITGQNCRLCAGNSIYPDKLMQYKYKDEYFSKATGEAKAKQNVIHKIVLDLNKVELDSLQIPTKG